MAPLAIRLDGTLSPIEALSRFSDLPGLCLLHSAAANHPLSRFSFLAADPVASIGAHADRWPEIRDQIRATLSSKTDILPNLPPFQGGWMGWFSYELGTAFDDVIRHPNQPLPIPDVALGLYDWVIAWDHERGDTWLISTGVDATGQRDAGRAQSRRDVIFARWRGGEAVVSAGRTYAAAVASGGQPNPRPATRPTHADFTPAAYQTAVARVVEYVLAGDIFQANLAQRFTVPFAGDAVTLYRELTARSSAPMAAFVRHADISVVSASPEQFIRLDAATGNVETRPIKGTRPRAVDTAHDAAFARELQASEKDRAENVMIVDLLRNDLSRVCRPGTVRVPVLCALESHPTVHHLVSTVIGELDPAHDALDLIAATFPGGSISGAPKLRAMAIIRELEPVARGVYSGAIGWIGLDGSMDTSIAIRTVAIAAGIASLHAGGGITARSVPADEYQETLDKARALLDAVAATA